MKVLKFFIGLIVLVVLAIFIISLIGPKDYEVERSKEINASAAAVYDQVVHFNKWEAWSSWAEQDPGAEYTVLGQDGKVGTKQSWKGDKSGEGSMEIMEALPFELVSHKLVFTKPYEAVAKTRFMIEAIDSTKSKLTWNMTGKNDGALARIMGFFMSMDAAIGKDFERGLFKLDSVLVATKAQASSIVE
jgi:hypothetical protein